MSRRLKLNRQARSAIAVLVLLILVTLVFAARGCVARTSSETSIDSSGGSLDEIVDVGGRTLHLAHGSNAEGIARWLSARDREHAFDVSPATFVKGGSEPSPNGRVQIDLFANVMRMNPRVTAEIFVRPPYGVASGPYELEAARARRLRDELIANQVDPSRVIVSDTPFPPAKAETGKDKAAVVILLTRRET